MSSSFRFTPQVVATPAAGRKGNETESEREERNLDYRSNKKSVQKNLFLISNNAQWSTWTFPFSPENKRKKNDTKYPGTWKKSVLDSSSSLRFFWDHQKKILVCGNRHNYSILETEADWYGSFCTFLSLLCSSVNAKIFRHKRKKKYTKIPNCCLLLGRWWDTQFQQVNIATSEEIVYY